jgi:hypothetical protein
MIFENFIAKVKLDITGITLQFDDIDDGLMINVQSSSRHFFQANNYCFPPYCVGKRCANESLPVGDVLFKGQPWDKKVFMPVLIK